jgi:hypothetical protein
VAVGDAGWLLLLSPFREKDKRVTAELAAQRNRFVAAISDVVLIPYAAAASKTEALGLAGLGGGSGPPLAGGPGAGCRRIRRSVSSKRQRSKKTASAAAGALLVGSQSSISKHGCFILPSGLATGLRPVVAGIQAGVIRGPVNLGPVPGFHGDL